jgi:hypothetical protein
MLTAARERCKPLEPRSLSSSEMKSSWRLPPAILFKVEPASNTCNKTLFVTMIMTIEQITMSVREGKPE